MGTLNARICNFLNICIMICFYRQNTQEFLNGQLAVEDNEINHCHNGSFSGRKEKQFLILLFIKHVQ